MFNILNKPSTYVIKSWEASDKPNKDGVYVNIKGRKSGIVSYLFSLAGLDPIVSLIIDRENIRFKEASIRGFTSSVTSISKVCTGKFGYSKPFIWLLSLSISGFYLLTQGGSTSAIGIGLILLGFIIYSINKTTTLSVTFLDGGYNGFAFKRSIIEGKNIDAAAAERIIAIIEMIMLGRDTPRVVPDEVSSESKTDGFDFGAKAHEKMEALKEKARDTSEQVASKAAASLAAKSSTGSKFCPSCGETITKEDKFCGGCGKKTSY